MLGPIAGRPAKFRPAQTAPVRPAPSAGENPQVLPSSPTGLGAGAQCRIR